ncbi:MAG: hypothetical protein SFZ23_08740 [Planctomycetota bacterium]|nr:hypothetical protein [Planctomycetota bacterium]
MAAKQKRNKFERSQPFGLVVCNAIRYHVGTGQELEAKRAAAFEARDAAKAELEEAEDETDEMTEAKTAYADAVLEIDRLSDLIKFHRGEIVKIVKEPDQEMLEFPLEPPEDEKRARVEQDKARQGKLQPKPADAARPAAPGVLKLADGEGSHLLASINELDLPGPLIAKLRAAQFDAIDHLVEFDGKPDELAVEASITSDQAKAVLEGLRKFREKHRTASKAATKGATA